LVCPDPGSDFPHTDYHLDAVVVAAAVDSSVGELAEASAAVEELPELAVEMEQSAVAAEVAGIAVVVDTEQVAVVAASADFASAEAGLPAVGLAFDMLR
jgi:hypothetical protein